MSDNEIDKKSETNQKSVTSSNKTNSAYSHTKVTKSTFPSSYSSVTRAKFPQSSSSKQSNLTMQPKPTKSTSSSQKQSTDQSKVAEKSNQKSTSFLSSEQNSKKDYFNPKTIKEYKEKKLKKDKEDTLERLHKKLKIDETKTINPGAQKRKRFIAVFILILWILLCVSVVVYFTFLRDNYKAHIYITGDYTDVVCLVKGEERTKFNLSEGLVGGEDRSEYTYKLDFSIRVKEEVSLKIKYRIEASDTKGNSWFLATGCDNGSFTGYIQEVIGGYYELQTLDENNQYVNVINFTEDNNQINVFNQIQFSNMEKVMELKDLRLKINVVIDKVL